MKKYEYTSPRANLFKCHVTNECLGAILRDVHADVRNDNIFQYATLIKKSFSLDLDTLSNKIVNSPRSAENNILRLILAYKFNSKNFQANIEKINEFSDQRKTNGVYYTPSDVTKFMIENLLFLSISPYQQQDDISDISNYIQSCDQITQTKIKEKLLKLSVFDPTCGTGAFIYQAFQAKISLLEELQTDINSKDILKIVASLHGNDMDCFSTFIIKIRLLFDCIELLGTKHISKIVEMLDSKYYNEEFVQNYQKIDNKFDLIIGNPPYVERTKLLDKSIAKYGNIYGDVLQNSFELLKPNGLMSMIIPISYVSTLRFSPLRRYFEENSAYQHIYNFSDRPDCLFVGVHQKLCILVTQKSKVKNHKLYTSDYTYWYKSERPNIFKNLSVIENPYVHKDFYPKVSNATEISLYNKIIAQNASIASAIENNLGDTYVYLNMRATFWIKSFIEQPYKMNEYKQFSLNDNTAHIINIIFNSTLFWWFWIKVSDCWHLTNKELNSFKLPNFEIIDFKKAKKLSTQLNRRLEDTKITVATKQTLYEYKHKECKDEIDQIDDFLAQAYGLTNVELTFIKGYQEQYRLSINSNKK